MDTNPDPKISPANPNHHKNTPKKDPSDRKKKLHKSPSSNLMIPSIPESESDKTNKGSDIKPKPNLEKKNKSRNSQQINVEESDDPKMPSDPKNTPEIKTNPDRRSQLEKRNTDRKRNLDRKNTDRKSGLDQSDPDQQGTDQKGTDQKGTDQKGADQKGADQKGADQKGTDCTGRDSPDNGPPPPVYLSLVDAPLASLKLRDKCAREIYDTEISYVTSLETLVNVFIIPMRDKKLITKEDAQKVFSNVETILEFSREQVAHELKLRMSIWSESQTIGDIFKRLAPFLRLYKTYCDNYETALSTLTALSQKKNIASFLKSAEEACKGFSCSYYLIMPVQRVPRYQLLLRELISKTPETHLDFKGLSEAMKMITSLAGEVNVSVAMAERARILGEVMALGKFTEFDGIVEPHRQVIMHGKARSKVSNGTECQYILLFNDLCVFASETKTGKKKKDLQYSVKEKIFLNTAWIQEYSAEWYKIKTPNYPNLFLEKKSPDSKQDWYSVIQKQIKVWLTSPSITKSPEEHVINEKLITDDDVELRYTRYYSPKDKTSFTGHWLAGYPHGEGKLETECGVVITGNWSKGQIEGTAKATFPNGDVYEGEWQRQVPHGNGKLSYSNNSFYEGNWQSGVRQGQGKMVWCDGSSYIGQWENNKMNGSGILSGFVTKKKEKGITFTYEGQFKNNIKSGTGTLTSKNKSYSGEWENNMPHGKGTETTPLYNYTGNFVDGLKTGQGKIEYKNKNGEITHTYVGHFLSNQYHGAGTLTIGAYSYEGNWKLGKKSGQGKEICPEKGTYDGEWKDDLYHGKGNWNDPSKSSSYVGMWSLSQRHGEGVFTYPNGNVYSGTWEKGRRKGKGIYKWKIEDYSYSGMWDDDELNGEGVFKSSLFTYEGQWSSGKRNGTGTLTMGDYSFTGTWKNGKKNGQGTEKSGNITITGNWVDGKKKGDMLLTDISNSKSSTLVYKEGAKLPTCPGVYWAIPDSPEWPAFIMY